MPHDADVLIIGAGPAGSLAAARLLRQGLSVTVLERAAFPRFSIGESLLPQSMGLLEEADLLRPVVEAGFQYKNGAGFVRGRERTTFDFREKSSPGWGSTYQVPRADFDQVLAREAERKGARVLFRHEITAARTGPDGARLEVRDLDGGGQREFTGRFVLDASGNAKVLPRLLGLETPSRFPSRRAVFTQVRDRIAPDSGFDRNKILIAVHPERKDVWYWLIPFSDGRCSLGVVSEPGFLGGDRVPEGENLKAALKDWVLQEPSMRAALEKAEWSAPAGTLGGYASDVKALHGPGFALLGNAAEFLDPVFSSGVTIAFKSAALATDLVARELGGRKADWEADYAIPLRQGLDCFRAFVTAWYDGSFQDILFYERQDARIRREICSILAGYAWDRANPYVAEPQRLRTLAELCARA